MWLPEQELHGATECFEVDEIVQRALVPHVAEYRHSNDCIDKSDESEQGADVEQGRQGDDEGEEQLPDALGGLDQPEDPADPEHPDHSQQGGRDWEVGHEVLHEDANDGGDH